MGVAYRSWEDLPKLCPALVGKRSDKKPYAEYAAWD
jgi:hypothetical protein